MLAGVHEQVLPATPPLDLARDRSRLHEVRARPDDGEDRGGQRPVLIRDGSPRVSARAGEPTTVSPGATSRVTTAPAPTRAPLPIRTPPRIVAFEPTVAPCS